MNTRLVFLVAMALGTLPAISSATRLTERWITINPLGVETTSSADGFSLLDVTGFWGEFGVYGIETDIEHAYNIKLGGFIELFRSGRDWSLAFVSDTEWVANRRDGSFFRPRAAFWKEGFLFTRRSAGHRFWQLGYVHRCKHDVDNLGTDDCDGGGCERTLINGSLQGKLLIPLATGHEGRPTSMLTLHGDVFTILQDERTPGRFSDRPPDYERALGAVGFNVHVRRPLRRDWLGVYANAYSSLQFFGGDEGFFSRFEELDRVTWHGGLSDGVALLGTAHLRLGIAYEYLEDTSINPYQESSHLVSFGFTVINAHSMW